MATIPFPGSNIRHVRKTITFTGGANAGALGDDVPVFAATGRVLVESLTSYISTALVCTAPAVTTLKFQSAGGTQLGGYDGEFDFTGVTGFYNQTNASIDDSAPPILWNFRGAQAVAGNIVLSISDAGGGAAITGGVMVVDCWYRPITDDGALAGDDIDIEMDDYIAAAVWAAVTRTLTAGTNLNDLSQADIRTALGLASPNLDTQLAAIPTLAELQAEIDAVQTDIANLNDPDATAIATAVWASATRTLSALGFTLGASDLAADTIGASELAADAITEIVNGVWQTALTEAYNTDGAAPTGAQALFVIMQRLVDFAISGTTITVKKIDGTTTAYTLTLDDATSPTSSARAT